MPSSLRSNVLAAKQRLAEGHAEFERRHRASCSGIELCAAICDLRDEVLVDLTEAALADLHEDGPNGLWPEIALVAHAGYGRRDVAPFSDVDLMILHSPGVAERVTPLAERLLRDVFDTGLILGHSVRTPDQAWRSACSEPMICTSLVESRLVRGNTTLFNQYKNQLRRHVRRRAGWLLAGIEKDRSQERLRYGETVFLLEPNVKRSRGALRDIQLIRWIGLVRYGTVDFRKLHALGALHEEDWVAILAASDFLLRLRNELHFHARHAADVLDRSEQLRIAELRGYQPRSGLLPVEQFMRDYFRHTDAVSHIAAQFAVKAQAHDRMGRFVTAMFGHRVEDGIHVGPAGLLATERGLRMLQGNLTAIVRLADLANLYDVPIAAATWEAIRHESARLPKMQLSGIEGDSPIFADTKIGTVPRTKKWTVPAPSPDACRHFLSLLAHPSRLAPLLRDFHSAGLLERFIPEFEHARGLLQFNQYHKYTVDEHCLRAVEFATELVADSGPVGRVYRSIAQKHLLHLAMLIHDLGKGRLEDHREVGLQIAADTAARLGLPPHETEALRFLVHKHMLLNHLAFRRDTADQQLAVQLAVQVGSPELLQMLYVLTAADLGAVGPNVWDGWKTEVVTDLYHRTMQHLAGDSPETTIDAMLDERRAAVRTRLGADADEPWFVEHLAALPAAYFSATSPEQAAADLRLLHDLSRGAGVSPAFSRSAGVPPATENAGETPALRVSVSVAMQYQAEIGVVQCTIATSEAVAPGIFSKLTGALSSIGLQIRSAQIHTLAGGLVLDRFWVHDPDYAGEPPPERLAQIERSLIGALTSRADQQPTFRRMWQAQGHRPVRVPGVPTRVQIDNSTSSGFTIIDVFTHDRAGLLYTITCTLFELGLSVGRAKIGTFLDQVVDVFYVTDRENRKIKDEDRLEEIRRRLVEAVESTGKV
jgi:[protein-PII] uridylyltransferase